MKAVLFVAVVLAVFAFISIAVVDDSDWNGFEEKASIMEAYDNQ